MLARIVGGTAGAVATVLWVYLALTHQDFQGLTRPPALIGAGVFGFLALQVAVAAVRDEPLVLLLCAFLCVVPIGLFLALSPTVYRWIGWLDLLMLASGIVLARNLREPMPEEGGSGSTDD